MYISNIEDLIGQITRIMATDTQLQKAKKTIYVKEGSCPHFINNVHANIKSKMLLIYSGDSESPTEILNFCQMLMSAGKELKSNIPVSDYSVAGIAYQDNLQIKPIDELIIASDGKSVLLCTK